MIDRLFLEAGKRCFKTGKNTFLSPSDIPLRRMTSMMPVHRQVMPQMPIQRLTALPAPSSAALPTASIRPVKNPKITETATIAVQIQVRAISLDTPYKIGVNS